MVRGCRVASAAAGVLGGGGIAGSAAWWKPRRRLAGGRVDRRRPALRRDALRYVRAGLTNWAFRVRRCAAAASCLPNLVETAIGHQHINTHPSIVVAVAEAFRRLDAASVVVAGGAGASAGQLCWC